MLARRFERMISTKEVLIFALNSKQPEESKRLVQFLRYKSLDPQLMICAEGVYRNYMEDVYIVPWAWHNKLHTMITAHKQHSVLHVKRNFWTIEVIIDLPTSPEHNALGTLTKCGAGKAQQQTAYTKVGESFYITE